MQSCAHGVGDATPRCRAGGLRGPLPINRTQPLSPPNPAAPRHGAILRQQPNGGGATTPLPAPPQEMRAGPSGRAHRGRGGGGAMWGSADTPSAGRGPSGYPSSSRPLSPPHDVPTATHPIPRCPSPLRWGGGGARCCSAAPLHCSWRCAARGGGGGAAPVPAAPGRGSRTDPALAVAAPLGRGGAGGTQPRHARARMHPRLC